VNNSQTVVAKARTVLKRVKTSAEARSQTGANLTSPKELHQAIMLAAYYLAEARNFEAGHELEDWLNAEAQIMAELEGLKGFPA